MLLMGHPVYYHSNYPIQDSCLFLIDFFLMFTVTPIYEYYYGDKTTQYLITYSL